MNMTKLGLVLGISALVFLAPGISYAERALQSERSSDHSSKLTDELIASDTARSLMLAALHTTSSDPSSARSALLQRARDKNPNDALINALIIYSHRDAAVRAESYEILLHAEPENGAVQLGALSSVVDGDEDALDAVLHRLASATTFDEHLGDVVVAWLDQFDARAGEIPLAPHFEIERLPASARPLIYAIGSSAAVSIPGLD